METTRWTQVRAILEGALELAHDERARFLALRCDGDSSLRSEVDRLLAQEERAAAWVPPDRERLAQALGDPNLERRFGPYRIESKLGSGGMGTVYRARRVDADFEQVVALKLIKRGMDTDEVLQRFRVERDALAELRHPFIAHLYDAGASDDGLPWIAMELIEGAPIDRWCDARRLDVRGRVLLFLEVCRAVQHAHQHLVVHRDLKPSNILVTDGGVPKLLDFGIAKLLDTHPRAATRPTLLGQRPLTPEFASPEQVRGESTSTATDVYSLGVILHLLLSGALPFPDALGRSAREPDRPSTKVRPEAAQARALDERTLRRTLSGDLDTIVQASLATDVQVRYASVDALAADLRSWLDGLPIQARRASALYVARKFVARHRVAVVATLAFVASLVAGLVGTYLSYREADKRRVETEQARTLAEQREALAAREAARANSVLALVNRMLSSASPHEIKLRDYTLRQLLDDFDADLRSGEPLAPDVELSIRTTMGRAYREIGVLDRARPHLERARTLESARAEPSASTLLASEWADLLHDEGDYAAADAACATLVERASTLGPLERAAALTKRGDSLSHLARFAEAEPMLREAVELQRSYGGAKDANFAYACTILADMLALAGRMAEAEDQHRAALAVWLESSPESGGAATALSNLANVLHRRGKLDEAEQLYRRALAIESALRGPDHPGTSAVLTGLGTLLATRSAYDEAEPMLREALDISRAKLGPDHPSVAGDALNLAGVLEKEGRNAEAVELCREGLRIRTAALGEHHPFVAWAMSTLGGLLMKVGQLDEAEAMLRRAVEIFRTAGDDTPLATSLQNLGALLSKRGHFDEAIALQRESLELSRCAPEGRELEIALALNNLASCVLATGNDVEAERYLREALELRARVLGDDHPDVARCRSNLGLLLCHRGEAVAAEPWLRRALDSQRGLLGDAHLDTARSAARLSEALVAQDRIDEAIVWLRFALPVLRAVLGEGHAETLDARRSLDELLERAAAR